MTAGELSQRIDALLAAERLPPSFRGTIETIHAPLAAAVAKQLTSAARPCIVGVCGPQGSGKSTGVAVLRLLLEAHGLAVATLSLDDLYLTRDARGRLAASVHPLLQTRGPPGTHDLALGVSLLNRLTTAQAVTMPSFDKAIDDQRPPDDLTVFAGPADIVLFEGWCVGAVPEEPEALVEPVNALERACDANGIWRRYVNAALAQYQTLFARIDYLILLQPPGFEVVASWRREQEAKLRARTSGSASDFRLMSDDEIERFVQHYERVTRHIMREMPQRAQAVVALGSGRELEGLRLV